MVNLTIIFITCMYLFINYIDCANKFISKGKDAINTCLNNKKTYIAIIWPITLKYKNYKKIDSYLSSMGTILYKSKIVLKKNGPKALINSK